MKTKLIISGLALMAVTTLGSAQNYGGQSVQQNTSDKSTMYVDANKDGICDNKDSNETQAIGRKGYGNYQRDNSVSGQGQHIQQGLQGQRGQRGQSNGISFIDTDKNGVCDYYEIPTTN